MCTSSVGRPHSRASLYGPSFRNQPVSHNGPVHQTDQARKGYAAADFLRSFLSFASFVGLASDSDGLGGELTRCRLPVSLLSASRASASSLATGRPHALPLMSRYRLQQTDRQTDRTDGCATRFRFCLFRLPAIDSLTNQPFSKQDALSALNTVAVTTLRSDSSRHPGAPPHTHSHTRPHTHSPTHSPTHSLDAGTVFPTPVRPRPS